MCVCVCVCVCVAGAASPHVRGLLSEQAEVRVHRHRVRELLRGNTSLLLIQLVIEIIAD